MNDQNNNFTNDQPPVNPYNYDTASNNAPTGADNSSATPVYTPEQAPAPNDTNRGKSIKAFIFGIVALECCSAPFISIIAIIFGAIAKKDGAAIMLDAPTGATRVFAMLGKIFGLIGFIIGIIMTALSPFWLIGVLSGAIESIEFSFPF